MGQSSASHLFIPFPPKGFNSIPFRTFSHLQLPSLGRAHARRRLCAVAVTKLFFLEILSLFMELDRRDALSAVPTYNWRMFRNDHVPMMT
jgi:hypothetical protein